MTAVHSTFIFTKQLTDDEVTWISCAASQHPGMHPVITQLQLTFNPLVIPKDLNLKSNISVI